MCVHRAPEGHRLRRDPDGTRVRRCRESSAPGRANHEEGPSLTCRPAPPCGAQSIRAAAYGRRRTFLGRFSGGMKTAKATTVVHLLGRPIADWDVQRPDDLTAHFKDLLPLLP